MFIFAPVTKTQDCQLTTNNSQLKKYMSKKKYAIIDIETTGGRAARDKITEIAIVVHDGEKILDTYESLVNPETSIPYNITRLTGIDNNMVANAPKFYEIAKEVVRITEGTIFVAHNVRFDYSFIKEEFKRLGFSYSRKQLCTVRLSRKAFPGLRSYSLGNLIKHFKIKVNDRHRAMADTMATVELFEKILKVETGEETVEDMVNLGMKESMLPKSMTIDMVHALPDACGVYYMHDINGDCVYVGKSINIRKRIAQHFAEKSDKSAKLQRLVHDITFELTGSELGALLLESHEIKRLRPPVNRAQRTQFFPYAVYTFENEEGYICFDAVKMTAKMRKDYNIVGEFPKLVKAKNRLAYAVSEFELCDKYCGLDKSSSACFKYHLRQCKGACKFDETPEEYNERARKALDILGVTFEEDFFVLDTGRDEDEQFVTLVQDGDYQGFGYISKEETNSVEDLFECIKSYPNNPENKRIIARYLADKGNVKVVKI